MGDEYNGGSKVAKTIFMIIVAMILLGILMYFAFYSNVPKIDVANFSVGCLFGLILGKFLVKVESYKFADLSVLAGVVGVGAIAKIAVSGDAYILYFIALVAGFLLHMVLFLLLGGNVNVLIRKGND